MENELKEMIIELLEEATVLSLQMILAFASGVCK